MSEYNQCQTQLKELYSEGIQGNVEEFTAYRVMYLFFTNGTVELAQVLKSMPRKVRTHSFVVHALRVGQALSMPNYHDLFVNLYPNAPNMGVSLMDLFIDPLRVKALKILTKGFEHSHSCGLKFFILFYFIFYFCFIF